MPDRRYLQVRLAKSTLTYHFDDGDYALGDRVIVPLKRRGAEAELEFEAEVIALDVEKPTTFETKALIGRATAHSTSESLDDRKGAA